MTARDFKRVILFMANRWERNTAIDIFGEVMGLHFWNKWVGNIEYNYQNPDQATMRLFYEMSDNYLQVLLDYIDDNYDA